MSAPKPEGDGKQEMNDSGCVVDESLTKPEVMENGYRGQAQLLDLSDDVLLCILKYCSPQDLKALGFTCARLGALVLDRSLWVFVDARSAPTNRARMQWLLQALHSGTHDLMVSGHANEARGCRGHVNRTREEQEMRDMVTKPATDDDEMTLTRRETTRTRRGIDFDGRYYAAQSTIRAGSLPLPRQQPMNEDGPEPPFPLQRQQHRLNFNTARLHINAHQLPRQSSSPSWPEDCEWDDPEAAAADQEQSSADTAGCPGPVFTLSAQMMKELRVRCPNLTTLSLEYCNINCNKISPSNFPPTIKGLCLRGTRCYNPPLDKSYLFRIHDYMPLLEFLDLSECAWLEPAALLPLSKLQHLEELLMRECPAMAEFVAYVSLATRYGFRALKILDLRGSPVGDSEVSALGWLPELRQLGLSSYRTPGTAAPPSPAPHHHYIGDPLPHVQHLHPWETQIPEYYKARQEPEWESPESSVEDVEGQVEFLRESFEHPTAPICIELHTRVRPRRPQRDPGRPPQDNQEERPPEGNQAEIPPEGNQALREPEGNQALREPEGSKIRPSEDKEEENPTGTQAERSTEDPAEKQPKEKEVQKRQSKRQAAKLKLDVEQSAKPMEDEIAENDAPIRPLDVREGESTNSLQDNQHDKNRELKQKEEGKKEEANPQQRGEGGTQKRRVNILNDCEAGPSKRNKQDGDNNNINGNNEANNSDSDSDDSSDSHSGVMNHVKRWISDYKNKAKANEESNGEKQRNEDKNSETNEEKPKTIKFKMRAQDFGSDNGEDYNVRARKINDGASGSREQGKDGKSKQNDTNTFKYEVDVNRGASTSRYSLNVQVNNNNEETEPPRKKARKKTEEVKEEHKAEHEEEEANHGEEQEEEEADHGEEQEEEGNEPENGENHEPVVEERQEPAAFQRYIRFRRNEDPIIFRCGGMRRADDEGNPEDRQEGQRQEQEPGPEVRQEQRIEQEQAEPRHHVLYVNLGQQLHAVYRLLPNRGPNIFPRGLRDRHTPTDHLDQSSLVTDSSIRRFGRADGEDLNIVQIGPDGPLFGRRDNSGRPNRSSLRVLVATGFRNITNRSLIHLATAAPHLVSIDFRGTSVTAEGVEQFKTLRPDVEVKFGEFIQSDFNLLNPF